jgi:DNA-binding NarL/FixJ family response regulator
VPGALIETAFCFSDARAQLNRRQFFAALFEIDTDKSNGPVSFRMLRLDCPDLLLGVLSRSASENEILSYLAAGVTGFILEPSDDAEVVHAILEIMKGAIYIPTNIGKYSACETQMERSGSRSSCSRLTPRQSAVLRLLLKGHSNKEIARQLDLSPYTVKIHVSALLRFFAVQKRSGLLAAAAMRSRMPAIGARTAVVRRTSSL